MAGVPDSEATGGKPGTVILACVPYAVALLACVFISAASYPGFMSFDSLETLREARGQVVGGPYPPFGAYVWRVLDMAWPGPTLMQFAQNALLMLAFAHIGRKIRLPLPAQIVAICLFALLPPILGIMLVVWKDVAVAGCLLAAFALTLSLRRRAHRGYSCAAVLVLLFAGMAYRYNAASAVVPLAAYLLYQLVDWRGGEFHRLAKAAVAGTLLTVAMFGVVSFFNSHRFPTMERLQPNRNMSNIQADDLIGISVHAPVSVLPDGHGGYVPLAYLRKIYSPVHVNRTVANDRKHLLQNGIPDAQSRWLDAIRRYPMAYLRHRSDAFGELVAFNDRPVFYPTHPLVEPNEYGITHAPTQLGNSVVDYVRTAADGNASRPWIYYDASLLLVALLFAFRAREYRLEAIVVSSSGILYLLPLYLLTPGADLRYNFWSICAALVAAMLSLASISRKLLGKERRSLSAA